ncbi:MAG: hypothetical protein L6R42_003150 [Xanthoria sp. 1 TBL-2021]|nr:MAG: hypothetical protein L6R42_003150 [Xanthoria sp. 1 TBL-2021]
MTAFTDLAFELRVNIYNLSLLISKTIYLYPTYYEEVQGAVAHRNWAANKKIAAGLLGTNMQIRTEAVEVLFGKNIWHLSEQKELPVANLQDVWTGGMPLIASLHLDSRTVDLEYCCCATCGCRLEGFVVKSQRMFGNFNTSDEALESEWDEYSAQKKLHLLKPTHFKDTKIGFKELDEPVSVRRLHSMGLGCRNCPLQDGRRDCANCESAEDPDGDGSSEGE